jgi:hypothetical protein
MKDLELIVKSLTAYNIIDIGGLSKSRVRQLRRLYNLDILVKGVK